MPKIQQNRLVAAVDGLIKLVSARNNEAADLLEDNTQSISLQFTVAKISEWATRVHRFDIKHSLYDENCEVCLFTKMPHEPVKEYLQANPIPGVKKVISIKKLERDFHEPKSRRSLWLQYDQFFCEDYVVEKMPLLCGKMFSSSFKNPKPIAIPRKSLDDFHKILTAAIYTSTWMKPLRGNNPSLVVGRCSMPAEHI
eukprot:Platyproteum_vivax@DN10317_c0_g1_i1.p1